MRRPVQIQRIVDQREGISPPATIHTAEVMPGPLFRQEAMDERQDQWLGTILLEPRIRGRGFTIIAGLMLALVLAAVFIGSYTRKARVKGWLVPESGFGSVYAPQAGVIAGIRVKNGESVQKGQALVVISTEIHSLSSGATREEVVRKLISRRKSLVDERSLHQRHFEQQEAALKRRIETLNAEEEHLSNQLTLQRYQIEIGESAYRRHKHLHDRGLTTETRLQKEKLDFINSKSTLQSLERSRASILRQKEELSALLIDVPVQRNMKLAELSRSVAALEQEIAEAESRRKIVITAPHDGIISDIQFDAGDHAQSNARLLNVIPEGSSLRAQLFAPTRAIGFLRSGQNVLLRYQAFPYQKFGLHEGIVTSVSTAAINPSELPQQFAGLTAIYSATEPVYRINVDTRTQMIETYGKRYPLQAGMLLEADVLIESRSIFEWLLEPLFSLTARTLK